MYLVRDIMYCKPGHVRSMVEKFTALAKLSKKIGVESMRVMTDVSAEQYWTVVSEMEVKNLEEYTDMLWCRLMNDKKFQKIMKGYHDLLGSGRW